MPVYNCGRYLQKAINSILTQTYSNFEFIIVNDGSTDNSLKIIRKYSLQDDRIKVISRPNTGIVGALNDGLEIAKGEFLARMDGDDVAISDRLEKQVALMENDDKLVALGTSVLYIDSRGLPLFTYHTQKSHRNIEKELLMGNGGAMVHPSIMVRKKAIINAGGYREEFRHVEDFDLYLRLSRIGRFGNHSEVLLKYRQHSGSVNFRENIEARQKLKLQILNEELQRRDLPPVKPDKLNNNKNLRVERYRTWSYRAVREGFKKAALKYAILSICCAPFDVQSWRHLKLVLNGITFTKIY